METVEELKAEVSRLSTELLEWETSYTVKRFNKSIAQSIQDLVMTIGYRHDPKQFKIMLPQTVIDIFNEERDEFNDRDTKVTWDAETRSLQRFPVKIRKNFLEYMGVEVELVPYE